MINVKHRILNEEFPVVKQIGWANMVLEAALSGKQECLSKHFVTIAKSNDAHLKIELFF